MTTKMMLAIPIALALSAAIGQASAAKPETFPPLTRPPVVAPPVTLPPAARPPVFIKAPEIDATAGVQAIALLSGMLLLVAERTRRRRG